ALSYYYQDCQSGQQAQEQDQHIRLHIARLQLPEHPAADHERAADAVDDAVDHAPVEFVHVLGHPARHPAGRIDHQVDDVAIDPGADQGQPEHAADEDVPVHVIDVTTPLEDHPDGVEHLDDPAAGNQVELVDGQGQQDARYPHGGGHTEDKGVELRVVRLAKVHKPRQPAGREPGHGREEAQDHQRVGHDTPAF